MLILEKIYIQTLLCQEKHQSIQELLIEGEMKFQHWLLQQRKNKLLHIQKENIQYGLEELSQKSKIKRSQKSNL